MSRRLKHPRRQIRLENLERRELLAGDCLQNPEDPLDVNGDAFVSSIDALQLINEINLQNASAEQDSQRPGRQRPRFADVNGDGVLSPMDPLMVINGMRQRGGGGRHDGPMQPPPPSEEPVTPADPATLDGTNNNLANPELGSVGQPLERWFSVEYEDGSDSPAGGQLASPRAISNIVNASPGDSPSARGLSDLTWLFGQFIDHDITLSAEGHDEYFNIEVPTGDAWFDPFGTGQEEISLTRSGYELDESGVRQQVNAISSFIDGSVIYGSDPERADALRSFQDGLLKVSEGNLLPFNEAGLTNAGGTSDRLFLAGDIRANENAALSAMHTLWVREHNRLAERIAQENPELSDEEIFQRARRLVTAELQAITYNEYLPALLGEHAIPRYQGYDESVNPNISNEFATAAYRFGHTMLSSELQRLNQDGSVAEEGNLSLQEAFFNPAALTENGIDSILFGAAMQTAQEVDPFLVDEVRNLLFGPPGAGGFDLAALNIQRGRDHGLPSYNQIREQLGIAPAESFADISSDPEVQSRLEEAYGDVDAIDAWVGMLAEDHLPNSSLGITAGSIIAEQFRVLRDGDRYFYENQFSGRQLDRIRTTTLADIIQRNTDIELAPQDNVFFAGDIEQSLAESGPKRQQLELGFSDPSATHYSQAVDQALLDLEEERRRLLG